jgi:predicted branched-subunit amino acid permease
MNPFLFILVIALWLIFIFVGIVTYLNGQIENNKPELGVLLAGAIIFTVLAATMYDNNLKHKEFINNYGNVEKQ